ncbi:hypothetical protein HMSSN036_02870 [Paenibacillus macerans]|nr:hypothetical protein HMSSN036_02870 [Paenibacillus macerans]
MLMTLLAISGIESTVAVTSRSAYSFLSAGVIFPLWPTTARPISFTCRKNRSLPSSTENPEIASSLSIVPPVWPKPRPDILATGTPAAATKGPSTIVVLSPTPPVECLSTLTPRIEPKSIVSPDAAIAIVKSAVSRALMP